MQKLTVQLNALTLTTDKGLTSGPDWAKLRLRLLPTALAWLGGYADFGDDTGKALMRKGEAVCAALNLYRYMLLRESQDQTNFTGVQPSITPCSFMRVYFSWTWFKLAESHTEDEVCSVSHHVNIWESRQGYCMLGALKAAMCKSAPFSHAMS